MENKTCIFSYGSNSISQLQGRVNNLTLQSYPAYVDNYKRIFVGHSKLWNGGVASLEKKNKIRTYGIIVYLSDDELAKLDSYEIGYTKHEIICNTGNAYAYIADDNYWITHPSQQYLVAIYIMLNEHITTSSIIISGIMSNSSNITNISKWTYPKDIAKISLESLFVIVNSHRSKPWHMPKVLDEIITKLNSINICTTLLLKEYLIKDDSYNLLNNDLLKMNHKKISYETYMILNFLLVD